MSFKLLTLSLSLCSTFVHAFTPGFPYGAQKVRGVNLGGWLVLEPWITPSLFDNTGNSAIIDEWTFGEFQDREKATAALTKHWDTWITESDFEAIAAAGLNHVRVPIGYWAFEVGPGEPYIQGQLPYLSKAVTWAQKHNLKLIIDLHGAPGSQNGFDNSGQKKSAPQWHSNQTNIDRTNAIIKRIATMFRDQTSTVPIIEPLNEPAGFYGRDVIAAAQQFYHDSYSNIRYPYGTSRQSNSVVMIHDAFSPSWDDFMPSPKWEGVMMDTHFYQLFSVSENRMSQKVRIQAVCDSEYSLASYKLLTVVGEWTPASTDCAKYLNGRGVGARYDGTHPDSPTPIGSCEGFTGKASSFSASYKTFLRKHWEAQTSSFEKFAGWIQWTWKAEQADDWSYQAGLANGWIPKDPTERQFPDICSPYPTPVFPQEVPGNEGAESWGEDFVNESAESWGEVPVEEPAEIPITKVDVSPSEVPVNTTAEIQIPKDVPAPKTTSQ